MRDQDNWPLCKQIAELGQITLSAKNKNKFSSVEYFSGLNLLQLPIILLQP